MMQNLKKAGCGVPLKGLFLSHQHDSAGEIAELATELRVRGIVPWVDKERGGFSIADESEPTARNVIRKECLGLLLYATRNAFSSDFIRNVEVDEARAARKEDSSFLLFAVAREMGFSKLKQLSLEKFDVDLSVYHGVSVGKKKVSEELLRAKWIETSRLALEKIVSQGSSSRQPAVSLQVSTRDVFPDELDDLLRVDASQLLRDRVDNAFAWGRLLAGLRDVKSEIARVCGRPRLAVHGSKHLTAAFMIGRAFAPFELDIRQTKDQVWQTDGSVRLTAQPLVVTFEGGFHSSRQLFVGVASRNKDVESGMDAFIRQKRLPGPSRLILGPSQGPLDVDNELCKDMVLQTYAEIEAAMQRRRFSSIHLFVAAPQAFMMMLGRQFKGMPPVHLHEWTGAKYVSSCVVPGGVL